MKLIFNDYDRLLNLVLHNKHGSVNAIVDEDRHHTAVKITFSGASKINLKRLMRTAITFVKQFLSSCMI